MVNGRCICTSSRRFSRLAQILPEKPFKNLIWHAQPDFALMAGQRPPSLPLCLIFSRSSDFYFFCFIPPPCSQNLSLCGFRQASVIVWKLGFCHLHVADNHFASLGALTLLYLPARNEIIRGVDEKLTSLLHLPVALSDGCHSNHYATEQTQWVKDGFECGSLRSEPGYDRADRPVRAAVYSPHNENSHIHLMSHTSKCRIEVEIIEIMSVFIPLKQARQVL